MSPAITRATAATARNPLSPTIHQQLAEDSSLPDSPDGEDRRSSSASIREPFVPKRKPTKPAPYAYILTQASTSADSLPNLELGLSVNGGQNLSVPARPASALGTTLRGTSPPSPQPSTLAPTQRTARTTRSASRNLALHTVDNKPPSASTSSWPATTPTSGPVPAVRDQLQPQTRPNTAMAVRTATPVAAPATPKIKAAVSADVAARIRSPKKHASTSTLRATASQAKFAHGGNAARPAHSLQQQASRDAEAYAHSSSTWLHQSENSADAEQAGENSFVYDADTDNADESGHDTVQVHVRLRPPKRGEECAWVANQYSGTIALEASIASSRTQSANLGPFTFDGIQTGSANRPVYISVARPLVRAALDGYDAVVFAYGQTASGKTFTLSGDEQGREAGIIPRAIRDIFRGIHQSSARREYLLRASYLEIWNEVVKDLLEPSNVPQVRDDKRRRGAKGTTVQPLREEIVTSPAQVRELLARGQANRHVGATDWNERSSRSHTCFKVTIESWERDADGSSSAGDASSKMGKKVTVSELCLIDLAGSEKYVSQGSDRRAEGAHINKSLLTLGKVIYALSEKSPTPTSATTSGAVPHIPYRDSKLTRILQNSLSGNARVAVVCTINPNPSAVDESLSTLNFAKRIKKVGLNARRNEVDGSMGGLGAEAQALILRYQTEADALRKMVEELRKGGAQVQQQEVVEVVDDERIRELQERLDVIGSLVVRGGRAHDNADLGDDDESAEGRQQRTVSDTSSSGFTSASTPATSRSASHSSTTTSTTASTSAFARPVSPVKRASTLVSQYLFGFDDSPQVLAEKLFLANRKIESLSRELASRPSLPSSPSSQAALIASLQQQVRELETVCEAQAQDAPPKIREDVEREYEAKLTELQRRVEEKDSFIAELQAEGERLRRANAQLMELAHQQTRDMVENLTSPVRKLGSPLKSSDAVNTATPRRRMLGDGSPTKQRPRPMSLFNPNLNSTPFAAAADHGRGAAMGKVQEESAPQTLALGGKRRSISNDYTLLQVGTQEIEHEILLKSATIPASETFANFPPCA